MTGIKSSGSGNMKPFKNNERICLISVGEIGWEGSEEWNPDCTLTLNEIYIVEGLRKSLSYVQGPMDVVDIINDEGDLRGYHVDHFQRKLMSNEERMRMRHKELQGVH